MFKKFSEGLVFGAGFGISFVLLWYAASYVITPWFVETQYLEFEQQEMTSQEQKVSNSKITPDVVNASQTPFHELPAEELIKRSSIVALIEYETAADGRLKAIIKEFLKNPPDNSFYYNVGDEYPTLSRYPEENMSYGDGAIVFFAGPRTTMKMSLSYSNNRIGNFGDMPLDTFKEMSKNSN